MKSPYEFGGGRNIGGRVAVITERRIGGRQVSRGAVSQNQRRRGAAQGEEIEYSFFLEQAAEEIQVGLAKLSYSFMDGVVARKRLAR